MARTAAAFLAFALTALVHATDMPLQEALTADAECEGGEEACSVNALQVKGEMASAEVESSEAGQKGKADVDSRLDSSQADDAEFGPFLPKTSQCCLCRGQGGQVSFSPSGNCKSCHGHIQKKVTPGKSCHWDGGYNRKYKGKKACRQMCVSKYFNPYLNSYYNPYAHRPPVQNPYFHKPSQCCLCNGRVMFSPNGLCSKCHGRPQKTLTPKKICNWNGGYNKGYKGKKLCLQMCQTKYFPRHGGY